MVTPTDILEALENATGARWRVVYRDSEETRQEGWRLIRSGNPRDGIPKVIQGSLFNDKNDATVSEKLLANSLLGLPKVDLEAYINGLVKAQ